MKRIVYNLLIISILSVSILTVNGQSLELPLPSSPALVKQTIGLTEATINYSRPNANGRKIFGGLVPYDKVWRTGANKATSIEVSRDVKIGEKELKAGSYSIFTIPGEKEWTIIFNSNTELWGAYSYKKEEDVLRVTSPVKTISHVETFGIAFANVKENSGKIELSWETSKVSFDLTVDDTEQAKKNIEAAVKKLETPYYTYYKAAKYYNNGGVEADKALAYAMKANEFKKDAYWVLYELGTAQNNKGMKKEAIASFEKSIALGKDESDDSFVKKATKKLSELKSK